MFKKLKTFHSIKWSAVDKLSSTGIQIITMIVLGRLLGPESFGLIGLISIFIAISNVIIDGGFSSALIRKKENSLYDYDTAFMTNVTISLILYMVMFLSAHNISNYYHHPTISSVLRASSISIIIDSLSIIPKVILIRNASFKLMAIASLLSTIIGGGGAIIAAIYDFNVWSLVVYSISYSLSNLIIYFSIVAWRPSFNWRKKSFYYLWNFGYKLILAGLLDVVYNNIYQLVVNQNFGMKTAGQYFQASKFSSSPALIISSVVQRVSYPALAILEGKKTSFNKSYLHILELMALFSFPVMSFIAISSEPFLYMFLGPAWAEASVIMSVLAFSFMLYPVSGILASVMNIKGRSDLFLISDIIKKTIGMFILIITIKYNIYYMCTGLMIGAYFGFFINIIFSVYVTKIPLINHLKNVFTYWVFSLISSSAAIMVDNAFFSSFSIILLRFFSFFIIYILLCSVFFRDRVKALLNMTNCL